MVSYPFFRRKALDFELLSKGMRSAACPQNLISPRETDPISCGLPGRASHHNALPSVMYS